MSYFGSDVLMANVTLFLASAQHAVMIDFAQNLIMASTLAGDLIQRVPLL